MYSSVFQKHYACYISTKYMLRRQLPRAYSLINVETVLPRRKFGWTPSCVSQVRNSSH